jgi:hypothetical protein
MIALDAKKFNVEQITSHSPSVYTTRKFLLSTDCAYILMCYHMIYFK